MPFLSYDCVRLRILWVLNAEGVVHQSPWFAYSRTMGNAQQNTWNAEGVQHARASRRLVELLRSSPESTGGVPSVREYANTGLCCSTPSALGAQKCNFKSRKRRT